MNLSVYKLQPGQDSLWNKMVEESNGGTLFHKLDFLAYHGDRFSKNEHHLVFYNNETPYGIMPLAIFDEDGEKISGAYVKSADKAQKTDTDKVAKLKATFESALKKYNKPLENGRSFITANDLSDFFVDENGEKTSAMRTKLNRFKSDALKAGVTELVANGYCPLFDVSLL